MVITIVSTAKVVISAISAKDYSLNQIGNSPRVAYNG